MTEFETWANSIIDAYGMPNNDSVRFALASMIPYVPTDSKFEINLLIVKINIPMAAYKSKRFFGQSLLKSASNQIAAGVMQDLKQKQAEQIKASTTAESTVSGVV